MITIHNGQLVMEICCKNYNYRVVIKKDNLFDEEIIYKQKYQQTDGDFNSAIAILLVNNEDHEI